MIAFLAHFSPGFGNVLTMKSKEFYYWYNEEIKLYKRINEVKE